MNHSEVQKLWRRLRRQGFTIELTAGNHYRITHPRMRGAVFAPSTPSDCHSMANVAAKIRRAMKEIIT